MNYGVTEQEFDSALHKLKKMAAAGKTTGEELATLGDMIFYGYSQEESNAEQAMPLIRETSQQNITAACGTYRKWIVIHRLKDLP